MNLVTDTWAFAVRDLRGLARQPWWIAVSLVQPIIWLLLYGALFQNVVEIPGFASDDYVQFLVPGIVAMLALFSTGWSGMATLQDIERGVVARFLITPAAAVSLIAGRVLQSCIAVSIQAVIIIALALATGTSLSGGVLGVVVLILVSCVLGFAFGAFSNALALVARREDTVIAVNNFVLLPVTFLSSAFMQANLMPGWIQDVAKFNPVNWAVEAGREAVSSGADWGFIAERAGLLVLFAAFACWVATRAFAAYQRSV